MLVTWNPSSSSDVTKYRIYIAPVSNPSNVTLAAEVDAKYGSATVPLPPGEYYVYVVAVDQNGLESKPSKTVSVKIGSNNNTSSQNAGLMLPEEYLVMLVIGIVAIISIVAFRKLKHGMLIAILDNIDNKDAAKKVIKRLRKYGFSPKYLQPTEDMIREGNNMILFNRDTKEAYVYMDITDHMLLSKLDVSLASRGYKPIHKKKYSGERWHTGLALKIVDSKCLTRLIEYFQRE